MITKIQIGIVILLTLISCEQKSKLYDCGNMNIYVTFNHTDSYDSADGSFTRKYWNKIENVKLKLSEEEVKKINNLLKINDFFNLPSRMEYNSYKIISAQYIEFDYSNSCVSKKIKANYDSRKIFNTNKVAKFRNIMNGISNIIYTKSEIKNLQASNIFIE